jgi:hypothetical protein
MKRTNVIVDEKVLEKAKELSGEKTYSATINRALEEMVRKIKGWQALERVINDPNPFYEGYAEDLYGREWVLGVLKKLGHTGLIRTEGLLHDAPKDVAAIRVTAAKKKRRAAGR